MIWLALLLAQAGSDAAAIDRGAKVFAQSCAVGYCHGTAGSAGRAPRIAGRPFEKDYLARVTRQGILGTAMPGWEGRLKEADIDAVVAYMLSISSGSGASSPAPEPATLGPVGLVEFQGPPEAKRGRELFFDATRGARRCGTCHVAEGVGVAVGPNLAALGGKPSAASIRGGSPKDVKTARLKSGGSFPALRVDSKDGWLQFFDLSSPLPVLRSMPESSLTFSGASGWRHSTVVNNYSDAELRFIVSYLAWLNSQR